jgi:hypothetical protein
MHLLIYAVREARVSQVNLWSAWLNRASIVVSFSCGYFFTLILTHRCRNIAAICFSFA